MAGAAAGGIYTFRLTRPQHAARLVSRAAAQDVLGLAREPRVWAWRCGK